MLYLALPSAASPRRVPTGRVTSYKAEPIKAAQEERRVWLGRARLGLDRLGYTDQTRTGGASGTTYS